MQRFHDLHTGFVAYDTWEVHPDFNTYWALAFFDCSMSYTGMYEYVWNTKWHLWAGCDSFCNSKHVAESI